MLCIYIHTHVGKFHIPHVPLSPSAGRPCNNCGRYLLGRDFKSIQLHYWKGFDHRSNLHHCGQHPWLCHFCDGTSGRTRSMEDSARSCELCVCVCVST